MHVVPNITGPNLTTFEPHAMLDSSISVVREKEKRKKKKEKSFSGLNEVYTISGNLTRHFTKKIQCIEK